MVGAGLKNGSNTPPSGDELRSRPVEGVAGFIARGVQFPSNDLMRRLGAPALLCCLACLSSAAWSEDWWVAPGGDGDGSPGDPFGSVQEGLNVAAAGDVVRILPGAYQESLVTVRSGTEGARISLRGEPGGEVLVTASGEVLEVEHSHLTFEGLTFDGQYGTSDLLKVRDGGSFLTLRDCELRRTSRDCVDMGAPTDILIEGCLIHRCLNPNGDAHGVVGGAARRVTIRDSEIHTFSGDAVQFDPGREPPGWDDVLIEGCRLWLAPLSQDENGFPAGTVPGENAIDTKTWDDAPFRARLTVRNTVTYGFRDNISNMAAFNLKEKIDAVVDGTTVYESEIGFRLRGPTSHPGALVELRNAVVYEVDKAVRYEDDIQDLKIYNMTLGSGVNEPFEEAAADAATLEVRNLLLLGVELPPEATGDSSNLAVDATSFVDAAGDDYRLVESSPAVDAGTTIENVVSDRDGTPRPQGAAYDIGAYELTTTIFADGFESGDVSAWSATVP